MILQWINNSQKALEMKKIIMEITTKGFETSCCTIILEDGQTISNVRLIASSVGNNSGEGGQWAYYGTVTVVSEDKNIYEVDISTIKRVI